MIRSFRMGLLVLPAMAALSGCLNWQATYDELARNQCRALPGASDRSACLDHAADNARQKRAGHPDD